MLFHVDMIYHAKQAKRDVEKRAWRYNYRDGEGDFAPENSGIYSFIEHEPFDLSTPEGRIRAVITCHV